MNKHFGSSLDDLLQEDGTQEEVTAAAVKRVIAWQIALAMKAQKISKTEMASRMHTSRMSLQEKLAVLLPTQTAINTALLTLVLAAFPIPFRGA